MLLILKITFVVFMILLPVVIAIAMLCVSYYLYTRPFDSDQHTMHSALEMKWLYRMIFAPVIIVVESAFCFPFGDVVKHLLLSQGIALIVISGAIFLTMIVHGLHLGFGGGSARGTRWRILIPLYPLLIGIWSIHLSEAAVLNLFDRALFSTCH